MEPTSHESRVTSHGFTLLEIMISVGILGFIMTLIWSTTAQNLRSKERIETRDDIFHAAQVALRKIGDDVSEAFLVKASAVPGTAGGAAAATPTEPFKTFFIGEDRGERDAVRFSSLSHVRLVKDAKESDQCKVAYEVEPNPEDPRLSNLVRREAVWLDTTAEVEGRGDTLVENIERFDIEYYDERKGEWGKEWSTEKLDWAGRLPQAVRVTIAFTDPDDETQSIPLSTTVLLPLAAGPIEM